MTKICIRMRAVYEWPRLRLLAPKFVSQVEIRARASSTSDFFFDRCGTKG